MNVVKVGVLLIGLGIASYAVFWVFASLRNELSSELHLKQWYK